jgi:hypothetical protein
MGMLTLKGDETPQEVKAILFKMADEEKAHLKSLGDLIRN